MTMTAIATTTRPRRCYTDLGVLVAGGHLVQVQQGLVDALLQAKGYLHGVQTRPPFVTVRLLYKQDMTQ